MKRWSAEPGFTIVEVLVVLAVSTTIMVAAILSLNGKQSRVQFQQAINDTNSAVSETINNTASGFFPPAEDVSCVVLPLTYVHFTEADSAQGTNNECMSVGKVIHFTRTSIVTYTVLGRRLLNGKPVTSIQDAEPVIIDPGVTVKAIGPAPVNLTRRYDYKWGMRATRVINNTTRAAVGTAIGYFNELDGTAGNSLTDGAKGLNATLLNVGIAALPNAIQTDLDLRSSLPAPFQFPDSGVTVCLNDGRNYGRIQIGVSDNPANLTTLTDSQAIWTAAGCV
jgi:prepilin-type N-terminal cleavage/methylation domain-containing protein